MDKLQQISQVYTAILVRSQNITTKKNVLDFPHTYRRCGLAINIVTPA